MIPWLGWMDPQGYVRRMKRLRKMFDRFFEHVLEEHQERRRRERETFVSTSTDMVDLLLELADDPDLEVPMHRDGIKGFILTLIHTVPNLRNKALSGGHSEETMRLHPVTPMLAPRLSRMHESIDDIPARTLVFVNVWTIGRDPKVWESPTEFRPERFVGSKAAWT
ncbi:hypothetical protein PR202_gb19943 [Eleusine coracana subsp. coracana]|uniref:Cytochrome P450 n=1 Tax=Eleusine coracana subsp. coracana TaxID=191504 RepID=A0AAV5F8Y7_ELECO|nr:hypothetical protein PR202_gb19943 [Eleusine coracana subsp. coracana]